MIKNMASAGKQSNTLRIIAGQWRGRKLAFPDIPGLRPTPDRVRETLFNWLQPIIHGARCLDLFSGSGALGLEALSREAGHVVMVDEHPEAIQQLSRNMEILRCEKADLIRANAITFLEAGPNTKTPAFDVVFLDPPYHKDLLAQCCQLLTSKCWLKPGAAIYLEAERELKDLPLPDNWELKRSKTAGQVSYHLAIYKQP
jgi:16S rRNA (guanine966-N2)-methyltransferase